MKRNFVFNATIEALSPVLVGGLNEDITFQKSASIFPTVETENGNHKQMPVITGSSLKGVLRDLAISLGVNEKTLNELFGREGDGRYNSGNIIFSNFYSEENDPWDDRVRIKINNLTKTIDGESFFTIRAVRKGTKFEGFIIFRDEEKYKIFSDLFINGPASDLIRVGAMKTAGFGKVKLSLEERISGTFRLRKGLNLITLNAVTPYTSSYMGRGFGKSYIVRSKDYIPGSALKGALENVGAEIKYASHLYPGGDGVTLRDPVFLFEDKYGTKRAHNYLKDIFENRMKKEVFVMKRKNNGEYLRIENASGYFHIENWKEVNLQKIYTAHVSIDPVTKTSKIENNQGILFIQEAYITPKMNAYISCEAEREIPDILNIGGSRSRGFGLFLVEDVQHIDKNSLIEDWKRKIHSSYIALILRTHFFGDPEKVFGAELVDSIVRYEDYHFYEPESKEAVTLRAVKPGSVFIFKSKDIDAFLENLSLLKLTGAGEHTELGFGDFEILYI